MDTLIEIIKELRAENAELKASKQYWVERVVELEKKEEK